MQAHSLTYHDDDDDIELLSPYRVWVLLPWPYSQVSEAPNLQVRSRNSEAEQEVRHVIVSKQIAYLCSSVGVRVYVTIEFAFER